jgi:hypothetical protein
MTYAKNLVLINSLKEECLNATTKATNVNQKLNAKLEASFRDIAGLNLSLTCNIGRESTTISLINKDKWSDDITIYHREEYDFETHSYSKDLKWSLSYFTTSIEFSNPEHRRYIDYLRLLGVIADSIDNGTFIVTQIVDAIKIMAPHRKTISYIQEQIYKLEKENQLIVSNIKDQEITGQFYEGNLIEYGTASDTITKRCDLNRHDNVYYDAIRIDKIGKKTVEVSFRTCYLLNLQDKQGNYIKDADGKYTYEKVYHRNVYTKKIQTSKLLGILRDNYTKKDTDIVLELVA